ncbi:MAG: hypothetical protein R3A52_17395 [Polyangiales bacterium]
MRREELHRDLPEEPEPDDRHHRAEGGLDEAHAVERDGAHGDEARLFVGDPVGHAHREVRRDGVELGVVGDARARARDAVAHGEAARVGPHGRDAARERVPEGDGVVELVAHGVEGGEGALAAGLVEHLLHEVGALAGLLDEALARHVDDGALGARRDQ